MKYMRKQQLIKATKYKEIFKLEKMMRKARLSYEFRGLHDGWQVIFNGHPNCPDAVQHFGSYGAFQNQLEDMGGFYEDDVCGYMTAKDVFEVWMLGVGK